MSGVDPGRARPRESAFWRSLQRGVEVTVASGAAHKLLGVRDAFRRYFHDGLAWTEPVVVVPQCDLGLPDVLPLSDEETLRLAVQAVEGMRCQLGDCYHFFVGVEGGLHAQEVDGEIRTFVRTWSVVDCVAGQAWGSSGSLQLPQRLIEGGTDGPVAVGIPGTRRAGGMIKSLTGGLESRRQATAIATLHALSTLFYGTLGTRPAHRP